MSSPRSSHAVRPRPPASRRHWYRDRGVRTPGLRSDRRPRFSGSSSSTVTGAVNGDRASDLHARADAAVVVQQQVEAARYNLLWAANWQNITAWKARVEGGATAAAADGDNVAMYTDGAEGFEELFADRPDPARRRGTGQPRRDRDELDGDERLQRPDLRPVAAGAPRRGRTRSPRARSGTCFYVLDQAMTELETSVDARADGRSGEEARGRRRLHRRRRRAGHRDRRRGRPAGRLRRLARDRPRGPRGARRTRAASPPAT